jgi:hypothetical protein
MIFEMRIIPGPPMGRSPAVNETSGFCSIVGSKAIPLSVILILCISFFNEIDILILCLLLSLKAQKIILDRAFSTAIPFYSVPQ